MQLRSTNHILQDLVEGVANMETAIGIWRAIMQYKRLQVCPTVGLPFVEVIGALLEVFDLISLGGTWTIAQLALEYEVGKRSHTEMLTLVTGESKTRT
jgi:hypothetical protein